MCVCTELRWGSFLAVSLARVVSTVFVEWWESSSLVIRELLLVICLLPADRGCVGLLSVNAGRAEASVLR